ncbi:MAG: DUF438 domain-containing protein [Candidatus Aminicenantes bacterium]|nr:DUF438 domain-containing protein [Candidatus Aminicenantes bacterium]
MNQTDKDKQEVLKTIIKDLHEGIPVDRLQKQFAELIKDTSPDEIADMENALIQEGFPPEEIQRLCDVHAKVFESTLKKVKKASQIPGHPVYTFLEENKHAKKLVKKIKKTIKRIPKKNPSQSKVQRFKQIFDDLKHIIKHYERKENQLFPALEKKNFTGPTKVMWGKHDEIRGHFRKAEQFLKQQSWKELKKEIKSLGSGIKKLIFLEEKILYPTSLKKLDEHEWAEIKEGGKEIGYSWVKPSDLWDSQIVQKMKGTKTMEKQETNKVKLDEGTLTTEQIRLLLKSLPVEITFVDENDKVCFYSASKDRIFPRSPAVIGRSVQNCHPQKSVHVVDKIVKSFKEKTKDKAEFWLQKDDLFIYIRYFPVYDDSGEYKGVIEVSQEVSGIRSLKGQRRILDW